jgi:predicted ATPase
LILVDDVHWADSGTLALLRHLARRSRTLKLRLLIVLTYRETELDDGHPLNDLLTDLNRDRLTTRLKLSRLSRHQTSDLLAVMFEEAITPDFLDGIYRETEGNPFFIEEVCKALIEEGQLVYGDGRWQRPAMTDLRVPQSIRVAIQARVSKLPEPAQEALRLAAAFGREFEFSLLQQAANFPEELLIDSLEQATRAQLISETTGRRQVGAETFTFAHALIPTALRDSVSGLRRHRLHRRVAATLEAARPDDFETLAYQYAEAGDEERACAYYIKAGARAQKVFANQDAIKFYSEALTLIAATDPTRFEVLNARAAVYDVVANRALQRADAEAMLALADQLNDDARCCDAHLVLTDTWAEIDPLAARTPAEQSLTLARKLNDSVREARALRRIGWLDTSVGEYLAARVSLAAAATRFKAAGLPAEAAACLHILSLAYGRRGDLDPAKQAVEESIALSRASGDRRQEAIGLRRLGILADQQGRQAEGTQYALQALEIHRELGDRAQELNALANLSASYAQTGKWTEAAHYAKLTQALGEAIDASEGIAKGITELVSFYFRPLGDYGGALRFIADQLARERIAHDPALRSRILMSQGALLAQLGLRATVLERVPEVMAAFERYGKGVLSDIHTFVAFLQAEEGDFVAARQTLGQANDCLRTKFLS